MTPHFLICDLESRVVTQITSHQPYFTRVNGLFWDLEPLIRNA